ncbi:kinase-like domain-containing protein, partial [Daedaleopsis nitida]
MKAANKGGLLGDFVLVATPREAGPSDITDKNMDCAMYAKRSAPPETDRVDWSQVELSIETTIEDLQVDALYDECYLTTSDKGDDHSSRIVTRAALVFDRQHRTHYFTVVIFGTMARIVYWDRSGAVFTEKFNYKAEPHKLGKVLWCYSRLSPAQRGHDTTVVPVLPGSYEHELMLRRAAEPLVVDKNIVGEHARKAFKASVDNKAPCFKMTMPDATGEKTFLVGKPNFIASGLVGQGTRGYVAIDMADEDGPFVYLKDCWRVERERIRQEGDVLKELNAAKVPNIPTLHRHGDVPGQRTQGKQTFEKVYAEGHVCSLKTHRHYRMVVKEVGIPLWEFKNGKELVRVLLDCVRAHARAYAAGVIHRDISVGNILIYPDPNTGKVTGMLADWELSKKVDSDSDEPRQPDRTGTWQFTSVGVLNNSKKVVKIPDELESLLHVLLYIALHFIPHNCRDVSEFVCSFFDSAQQDNLDFLCGEKKE